MRVDEGRNCLESSHDENEDAYRSGVGGEEPAYCDPVSAFLCLGGEKKKKSARITEGMSGTKRVDASMSGDWPVKGRNSARKSVKPSVPH